MNKTLSAHGLALPACFVAILFLLGSVGCSREDAPASSTAAVPSSVEEPAVTDPNADPASTSEDVDRTDQLLRHAVFFQFKEDSSEEDILGVCEAFAALPSKIDSIVDFQWGVNDSPEGKNDGYTHCFLLSFKTAAERDAYIPNPAHSGEFAAVLRPHMKSAFVIDYWGTPSGTPPEKPLQHAVFFDFKDDAAAEDVKKVEEAFAALPSKIDAIKAFEWGTNNSPEGKDDGFTHCFLVTFESDEGRTAYLPHPDHEEFKKLVGPVLEKARVLDFKVK